MSMVTPTKRHASAGASTSATPGGHPSQSPPDTPLKTPRGLPAALPSDAKSDAKALGVASSADGGTGGPLIQRSLSDSNRDRLPLQTLGETRVDPSFDFEDPKATISSAVAAISRSDSSSFDRYKTGPASPEVPKSITDAEHALGLTERMAEERRKKQAELERRRKGSGGSGTRGGGAQPWEDELRAPAPNRFRDLSESGYDSDSRSLFGSYDPEVRGPRIFEEDEDDEESDGE